TPLTGTSFADTGVGPGLSWFYRVSAVDNAGNESAQNPTAANTSTPACPDTVAPSVPGSVAASATPCSNGNVGWSAVPDTDGSGLRGYYGCRNGTRITPTNGPLSGTSFADTGLAASTAYSYKVSAVDNANPGNESAQSTTAAVATTQACPVQPPSSSV